MIRGTTLVTGSLPAGTPVASPDDNGSCRRIFPPHSETSFGRPDARGPSSRAFRLSRGAPSLSGRSRLTPVSSWFCPI